MRPYLVSPILAAFVLAAASVAASAQPAPALAARAWLLADVTSEQILAEENADERAEPASLSKLMTAYLVFRALAERRLAREQTVTVSERAWRAPGSRMFLEPRRAVTVGELLRGMIVQSGNDASIALAEAVAGSEEAFVAEMNREAARLGMKQSRFANATGLPDPRHYSTARDLYRLAAALIRDFPRAYGEHYAEREYTYNGITQRNRNRLLWLDPSVDGVKTGYTEAAGWCLISSARRGERRLLAVVLGASSETGRAQESLRLLAWGFQAFEAVRLYRAGEAVREVEVWKGERRAVPVGLRDDLVVAVPKGLSGRVHAELVTQPPLLAPVARGAQVGLVRVSVDGKPYGERPAVALEAVGPAGLLGRLWDTLRMWLSPPRARPST